MAEPMFSYKYKGYFICQRSFGGKKKKPFLFPYELGATERSVAVKLLVCISSYGDIKTTLTSNLHKTLGIEMIVNNQEIFEAV